MGLDWPTLANIANQFTDNTSERMKESLDALAAGVETELAARGLSRHASPMWQHWDLFCIADSTQWWFAFLESKGGIQLVRYLDLRQQTLNEGRLRQMFAQQLGQHALVIFHGSVPPTVGFVPPDIQGQIVAHADEVEHRAKVGDALQDAPHLQPFVGEFLGDHPDRARNVFIMMRFQPSDQLHTAHEALVTTLAERGLHAIRADDRDYTGDLWSNIELCMRLSSYGIAIFEDIDSRDFNPNVSLELGYMLGTAKRVLILKEKRLPTLPADVVHKLYRPWDSYKPAETVSAEVGAWIDRDLRI